jgi:putative endonuclease
VRAPACRGGRRFDPDQVHQPSPAAQASARQASNFEGCRAEAIAEAEMPSVYILESQTNKRFYIGSALDADLRLAEHQRGQTLSTRGRGPWVMVYREEFATTAEARRRERQIKSWKSHRSIQELIESKR